MKHWRIIVILGVLALWWLVLCTLHAQTFTRSLPFLAKSGAPATTPPFDPTNNALGPRYWWHYADADTNLVRITNQWTDRVVGSVLGMMNLAKSPTNTALGVRFHGAQVLTNQASIAFLGDGGSIATGSVFMVFSFENPLSYPALFGESNTPPRYTLIYDGNQFVHSASGDFYLSSALPSSTLIDVMLACSNNVYYLYTNGVYSASRTNPIAARAEVFGALRYPTSVQYLKGYLRDYAWFSRVGDLSFASNLHGWKTNIYGP